MVFFKKAFFFSIRSPSFIFSHCKTHDIYYICDSVFIPSLIVADTHFQKLKKKSKHFNPFTAYIYFTVFPFSFLHSVSGDRSIHFLKKKKIIHEIIFHQFLLFFCVSSHCCCYMMNVCVRGPNKKRGKLLKKRKIFYNYIYIL